MKTRTLCVALIVTTVMASAFGCAVTHAGEIEGRVAGATADNPAVVWIEDVPAGETPAQDTLITHQDGRLKPKVSIGFVGREFVFRNEDDVLHNTHLYMQLAYQHKVSQRPLRYGSTLYNVALPKAGMEVRKPITSYHRYRDDTGFIEVVCNPHPDERAYVLIFDHRYASITGADGSFSIGGLPAGKHVVRIWHNGVVRRWKAVEINETGTAKILIEKG